MDLTILSIFPEIVEGYFSQSIMARAVQQGQIRYSVQNFRDFAQDKHRKVDDSPYGGGAGMLLKCEPIALALDSLKWKNARVVYPSASGKLLDNGILHELAQEESLIFISGRYEGIDQRIIDIYVDDEISLGNFVMSSGELASLVIIDAVYRRLEGVINKESLYEESYENNLLEYPQYTRPEEFRNLAVPEVLISGNHAEIHRWRKKESLRKTLAIRPDLIENTKQSEENKELLREISMEENNESCTAS